MIPTPISEEANDDDHETLDQVTTEPRIERSEWEKVELDKVKVPSPELENSSSLKSVPVIPTPISEEANDDDHEASDQVTTEPRRSSRVRSTPEW